MEPIIIGTYKNYVSVYNHYRKEGNIPEAIRVGRVLLDLIEKELKNPTTAKDYHEHFKTTAVKIREFLANASIGKTVGGGEPSSEDKIASTDWFSADVPNLKMKDVAGLQHVKDEFTVNVFAPLSPKYAPIYKKYRKDVGLQILLYGPPGTGKTHIVKCLAGQLGCKIAVVQIKDVMANLVGDGAKIIAEIFEQAKQYDRCIIFFDEIDAIAASREDDESRHTKEQLTTLLTNMDGFTSQPKPGQIRIIVAATNRPWILDSAVKRGGRFDTQIYIPLPDYEARKKLVEIALGKDKSIPNRLDIPCAPNVTVEYLAERFEGYAGADIKAMCKQMANLPLKREIQYAVRNNGASNNDAITRQDCDEVFDKYINSINDDMLIEFDAYSQNMSYSEYLKLYIPKARAALARGEEVEPHILRYIKMMDEYKS